MKNRVYIAKTGGAIKELKQVLSDAFRYSSLPLPIGRPVIVKPNFALPTHIPGVTTTPALMEALAELLVDHGDRLTFVEGDGGMSSWKAEEALYAHGVYDLEKRFGGKVRALSLMNEPVALRPIEIGGTRVEIPLPEILLDRSKFFITLPVLKTHCMTTISLAFKNQWGCVPEPKRCLRHHMLAPAVVGVCKLIGIDYAIIDAITAQDGNGPMFGEPVRLDTIIAGKSPGAVSRVGADVMGVNLADAPIKMLALHEGMIPPTWEIETSQDVARFRTRVFNMKRLPRNYISIAFSKSRLATKVIYDSAITKYVYMLKNLVFGPNPIRKPDVPEWVFGCGGKADAKKPGSGQEQDG